MPATTNKQRLLGTFLSTLKKAYGDPGDPPPVRPVLEEMVYAIIREGTTQPDADRACDRLRSQFFDWNEVRVSALHRADRGQPGVRPRQPGAPCPQGARAAVRGPAQPAGPRRRPQELVGRGPADTGGTCGRR